MHANTRNIRVHSRVFADHYLNLIGGLQRREGGGLTAADVAGPILEEAIQRLRAQDEATPGDYSVSRSS